MPRDAAPICMNPTYRTPKNCRGKRRHNLTVSIVLRLLRWPRISRNRVLEHKANQMRGNSSGTSVCIAFDRQQRQQQYEKAVLTFVKDATAGHKEVKRHVLSEAKPCHFLVYVTFSSTPRLLNFDRTAFETFKAKCETGEDSLISLTAQLQHSVCDVARLWLAVSK